MNVVILVGRLTKDPELRTTNSGKSVTSFSVAVNRQFKSEGQPDADFFNVVAWGRQAEVINQYLRKGREIALRGRLQTRNYTAQDGSKRYVTEVVLESFDFIGGRGDSQGQSGGYQRSSQPAAAQTNDIPLDIDDDFSLLAEDDDVPF
ncbi:MAG: single-stranded DNA-binding protein [Eubacteriaceae bacterium]|jgi:single-strand DNA-binding protein